MASQLKSAQKKKKKLSEYGVGGVLKPTYKTVNKRNLNKYSNGEDLPEYADGGWFGTIMSGASTIANFLPPPISTIAGPVLKIAGAIGTGIAANKQAQADADAAGLLQDKEQAMLDQQAADVAASQKTAEFNTKNASFTNRQKQISYGSSVAANGGDMNGLLKSNVGNPMITEYSDKAFKHGEGPNGIPVDSKGNPSSVSNNSAVGLTEGGEVTYNGYVFSDKLIEMTKLKKQQSYSSKAKEIMSRYKLRLGEKFDKGDTMALDAMNAELEGLKEQQEVDRIANLTSEELRQEMQESMSREEYAYGGDLMNPEDPNAQNTPFKARVPWAGAVSQGIGSILANQQIDFGGPEGLGKDLTYDYDEYDPTNVSANLVDYSRGREQTMRERDLANAEIRRGTSGQGARGNASLLAGYTGTQRAAGSQFEQSVEQQGNQNAQIKNQTSQFNAARQTQAQQMNAQQGQFAAQTDFRNSQLQRENTLINQGRKDAQISGVTGAITQYGQDLTSAQQYGNMLHIMAPEDYEIYGKNSSKLGNFFQTPMDMGMRYKSGMRNKSTG